jgi:hypothetical protein
MRLAIELHHVETLSGAACCQPIEGQYYKAAPLQALGASTPSCHTSFFEDDDEDENDLRPFYILFLRLFSSAANST